MGRAVARRVVRSLAVVATGVALLAITGCVEASPSPSPSSPETSPADHALTQTFDCADPIGAGATLADVAQDPIATDVMAIVGGAPGTELDPIQVGDDSDSDGLFFAKIGIAIKTGVKFGIVVPPAWQDRMRVGWSNNGPVLATTLHVPGCASAIPGTEWVVYPGGFHVKTAACVPLTIETDAGTHNIRVPVGKSCP